MLKHWNMLEVVYITDNKDRKTKFGINLNDSSHYTAKYLKILHLDEIILYEWNNGIENWSNLEYISLSHAHITKWPDSFSQLNKIAYIKLWDILYLNELPPNLCTMYNLRAINVHRKIVASNSINEIPSCIINLQHLQSVIFYFTAISSIPSQIFSMSSIQEIGFLISNVSLTSFNFSDQTGNNATLDQINQYSKNWHFEWNPTSQTNYYLSGSPICLSYDEYSHSSTTFPTKLVQFLNETGACDGVCQLNSVSNLLCSPFDWQNGVCNHECNVEQCYWDGGDCNQLCPVYHANCSIDDMFDNGVCDQQCNNSYCAYDNSECLVNNNQFDSNFNISQLFSKNQTYCNEYDSTYAHGECKISWINDGWCDDNCRSSESCFYDGNDCSCVSSDNYCNEIYSLLKLLVVEDDNQADNGQLYLTQTQFCSGWEFAYNLYGDRLEEHFSQYSNSSLSYHNNNNNFAISNCTAVFILLDANDDAIVDIQEFMFVANALFNLTNEKSSQINCTSCVY